MLRWFMNIYIILFSLTESWDAKIHYPSWRMYLCHFKHWYPSLNCTCSSTQSDTLTPICNQLKTCENPPLALKLIPTKTTLTPLSDIYTRAKHFSHFHCAFHILIFFFFKTHTRKLKPNFITYFNWIIEKNIYISKLLKQVFFNTIKADALIS